MVEMRGVESLKMWVSGLDMRLVGWVMGVVHHKQFRPHQVRVYGGIRSGAGPDGLEIRSSLRVVTHVRSAWCVVVSEALAIPILPAEARRMDGIYCGVSATFGRRQDHCCTHAYVCAIDN